MNPTSADKGKDLRPAIENISYVRQMLGELRNVAHEEGAEMLRYLIEMAYVEAGDFVTSQGVKAQDDFKPKRSAGLAQP